jgi:cytochrome c-type biogenesis protein CcmE
VDGLWREHRHTRRIGLSYYVSAPGHSQNITSTFYEERHSLMHPVRKKRVVMIAAIVLILSAVVGLVLYALQQNINLFYSPSQIALGDAPRHANIRAGGMVVKGSLVRDAKTLAVSFDVTDFQHEVTIEYRGILPDLFREGQGVVAQGKLNNQGVFIASQVLAKHDEKYMPPEISDALKNARPLPAVKANTAPSNY